MNMHVNIQLIGLSKYASEKQHFSTIYYICAAGPAEYSAGPIILNCAGRRRKKRKSFDRTMTGRRTVQ